MTIHDSGDFGQRRRRRLSQAEINATGQRLGNIVGDAARTEFNDSEFNAYSSRQIDRNMDIGGNVVDTRFDTFEPTAKRQDLSLDGSLGDKADNIRREVFAVKKVMSKAGAIEFKPGIEPTTVANARFTDAIKAFQAGNDLKVDGRIVPGGPSIHMLGRKALGSEDGKPSGYDAADFRQRTGRNGNRTLSGKPIFDIPGEGGGAGAPAAPTTLPIGGEANAPFGGPLELTSAKSESATGGEIAGKTAQPVRPPVTQRQVERESIEKLERNKQPGGPDAASPKSASEQRVARWIKDMNTEHPDFVRANALTPGAFLSSAAAKDIAKLDQLPKEYRAYIKASLEAGGTRAGQVVAFLRSLQKADPNFKEKIGFTTLLQAAGLWASAKRWGFGKEEFERLGAAKVYDLVARFERAHLAKGKDFQKLNQELRSNFSKEKYWEFRQKIENRIFKPTRSFELWSDRSFVDRLWRDGTLDERYEGWKQKAIDELEKAKKQRTITSGEALGILGLVPVFFPPARIPVAFAKAGAFALSLAEKLAKREFNRRLNDSELRLGVDLALKRRFLAQLKKERPNLFKTSE